MAETLEDLFVRPDYDDSRIEVTFTAPAGCSRADWEVLDEDEIVCRGSSATEPGADIFLAASLPGFKPWHVCSPHLYTLRLKLKVDGGAVEVSQEFGMRKIHVADNTLYVNNEKFYVKGYIRGREAHDHPNLEGLPLEEYYAKNIRMAKRYGFNFFRFHSEIPPEECFRAANRLGIFIHVEMRKYFGKYQKERMTMTEEGQLLSPDDWAEMVRKLRNHPSLMVYCMGNEIDHPGKNPHCRQMYELTKKLDPTRLFLDTCSRGEFDRKGVDLDVQHMSYFFPFGHSCDMFNDTQNWLIYGSCKDLPLVDQNDEDASTFKLMRRIPSPRPVLAHEVCHYSGLRDLAALDEKFARTGADKPWWLDELKKLVKLKGHEKNYPLLLEASNRFQFLCWKLGLEAARRSRVVSGFHFLQLADTERYENANGVIDCFDDAKGVDEKAFLRFNGDTVLLADLPRRTFFEKEALKIPVAISHYSFEIAGKADFTFQIQSADGNGPAIRGRLEDFDLNERGRRELCRLDLRLPEVEKPQALTLELKLTAQDGSYTIENSWNLWLYPNRPEELPALEATIDLGEVHPAARYPQIANRGSLERPEQLVIAHHFSEDILRHLENGGDVLMLYRVPATRDRKVRARQEEYYLPATWDRFKGVIWDRGHNCGAIIRASHALDGFPHDGFLNLQFHALVNDCDKIILDDFPAPVAPIMEGVDKATRDRFDVYNFKLSELQPAYTMRKFGYLFELKVGAGRLFVSGLNFTGLNQNVPETCAMFESLLRYVTSAAFQPAAQLSSEALAEYLRDKGKGPIVKERRMTQYWQLDEEPLESKRYWQEALDYLDDKPLVGDLWIKQHQEDKLKQE